MVEARGMYLLDDYPATYIIYSTSYYWSTESSPPKVFSGKGVPEICSKFTGYDLTPIPKYDLTWVFSGKFVASHFPMNTFGGLLPFA